MAFRCLPSPIAIDLIQGTQRVGRRISMARTIGQFQYPPLCECCVGKRSHVPPQDRLSR